MRSWYPSGIDRDREIAQSLDVKEWDEELWLELQNRDTVELDGWLYHWNKARTVIKRDKLEFLEQEFKIQWDKPKGKARQKMLSWMAKRGRPKDETQMVLV